MLVYMYSEACKLMEFDAKRSMSACKKNTNETEGNREREREDKGKIKLVIF